MKVRFYLRHGKYDPAPIMADVRYHGKRLRMATGEKVPVKFWNDKKDVQRVRNSIDFPDHAQINKRLDRIASLAKEVLDNYKGQGILPSPDQFKETLQNKILDKQTGKVSFLKFFQSYIDEREALGTSKGTLQNYRTALLHLKNWKKARRRNLDFETITEAWKNDFLTYLLPLKHKCSHTNKILARIKAVLKEAYRRGLHPEDISRKVRLSIPEEEVQDIYLNEDELEALFNLEDLSFRLSRVRDLFLIGAYTGMAYSDFTAIRPENIRTIKEGNNEFLAIVYFRKKTSIKVTVPLTHPILLTILKRHGMKAPEKISGQRMNEYLREIGQMAGFNQKIEVIECYTNRKERVVYEKWQMLGSHTARRSFATNGYKAGIPVPSLMKLTGHKKTASFLTYLKLSGEEIASSLVRNPFFTGIKEEE
jgi:integrase